MIELQRVREERGYRKGIVICYTHTHTHTHTYIYIERERDKKLVVDVTVI